MTHAISNPVQARLRWWHLVMLGVLFVAAIGIRAYDLTDPPFDFQPTRQFFTAIVARGEYYQNLASAPDWMRQRAVVQWQAEVADFPTIDALAAFTYRLIGHEDLFYPRLYSSLFWVLGGLAVFLLARDLVSPEGAILSAGFYLFAPYGIVASRSFQPDPLMICLILFSWWAMYRWLTSGKWKWAIAGGVLAGAAMLTKTLGAFSLLGGMAGVFFARNLRKSLRDIRFWVMGIIAAVPLLAFLYYGLFVKSNFAGQFSLRFFPALWIDPLFYLRFEGMLERVVGLIPLLLALLGFFLLAGREKRSFLAGLWGSYLVFAMIFAYYFMTHDYYHISLVPIVAISMAPLGDLVFRQLAALKPGWMARLAIVAILVLCFGANLWDVRQTLHKSDYRAEAAMLTHVGEVLGHTSSVVALTEDYAYPLSYYGWISAAYWPQTGDDALRRMAGMSVPEFTQTFETTTSGKQYFLVTDLQEFDLQSQLKEYLKTHYPVYNEGDGYIIYDLQHPITQP
jgi:4-amino-4-deoxy-L-arabinose transferase-like glycosyltransferase